ncbi:MAG: S9 family peptidase [Desulfurococcaceae archaeon]
MVVKKLQPTDFEYFTSLSQVSLDLTNRFVAVTAVKPLLSANEYKSWIEIYDLTSGVKVYVSGGTRDFLPRWSPDGRLFYLRVASDGKLSIVESIPGNGSREIITLDKPLRDYKVCKDDTVYAIVQDFKEPSDLEVVYTKDLPIWYDGAGFTHNVVSRLYKIDLRSGQMEAMTGTEYNITHLSLSKNCDTGVVSIAEDKLNPLVSKLYVFKPPSNELVPILDGKGYYIEGMDVEKDLLAFSGHKMERGITSHNRLILVDLVKNKEVLYEAPLGKSVGGRIYIDVIGPVISLPSLKIRDGRVYIATSDRGRIPLYMWDGVSYRELIGGNFVILDFDIGNDFVVFTRSDDISPVELYIYSLIDGSIKKLSNYNDWLSEYKLSKPKHFTYTASDGASIDGWIMEPVEKMLESGGKSPAVLEIHGGPKNMFGYAFMFEYQLLAANGFYVIYFNPRGSDGYSEEFADIRFKYGERDYRDIIEGLDYVLEVENKIDPNRLGVAGISYGGYMTNWIITHSDKFKTAISEDGISLWVGEYGVADIGYLFVPDQIGDPFNSPDLLAAKSPLSYVKNIKTPVLFIHGLSDYRCYLEQALVMYTALRHLGRECAIALFRDGSHAFSMVGKPKLRLKRYQVILNWLEKYLKKN